MHARTVKKYRAAIPQFNEDGVSPLTKRQRRTWLKQNYKTVKADFLRKRAEAQQQGGRA